MKYIYENHLGGFFCSDDIIEDTYCEECGDSDFFIGSASTAEEAWNVLKPHTDTFDDAKCDNCIHNGNYDYCNEECEEFACSGGHCLAYVMDFICENFHANNKIHEIYLFARHKSDTSYLFVNCQPRGYDFGQKHAILCQKSLEAEYVNQLARGLMIILDNPDETTFKQIAEFEDGRKIIHIFEVFEDYSENNKNWHDSAHYASDGWYGYIKRENIVLLPGQDFLNKYV